MHCFLVSQMLKHMGMKKKSMNWNLLIQLFWWQTICIAHWWLFLPWQSGCNSCLVDVDTLNFFSPLLTPLYLLFWIREEFKKHGINCMHSHLLFSWGMLLVLPIESRWETWQIKWNNLMKIFTHFREQDFWTMIVHHSEKDKKTGSSEKYIFPEAKENCRCINSNNILKLGNIRYEIIGCIYNWCEGEQWCRNLGK